MMPEATYELIEQYLQGELSETDRNAFEHRLKNDPELSVELEIHRAAFELVVDSGVLQAKEKLNRIHRLETGKENLWKWKIYFSGILLTALIGVGGYYYWSTQKQKTELINNSSSQSSVTTSSGILPVEGKKEHNVNTTTSTSQQVVIEKNKTVQKELQVVSGTVVKDSTILIQKKELQNDPGVFKSQDTTSIRFSVSGIDCSKVRITGKVDRKASCTHEATGIIMINLGTVRGGVKPYRYSITEEDNFGVSAQFNRLSPGMYTVKVKDHNGCSSIVETVAIESIDCPKEYAFAPSRGEEWVIPIKTSLSGEVKIMDRKGTTVYTSSFTNGELIPWTGLDQYGQELQVGVYLFFISYSNGDSQRGHVTILK